MADKLARAQTQSRDNYSRLSKKCILLMHLYSIAKAHSADLLRAILGRPQRHLPSRRGAVRWT